MIGLRIFEEEDSMGFEEVLGIILPIVYIVVGAALIWFVIELVMTIRKARSTVNSVQKQLEPTLDTVQKITANIEPVTAKVDPLVERVSLTVDAANLEILRVDQILEDASKITGSISNTLDSVDTVTNAPIEFVNSVTNRVRKVFKRKDASEESERLGAGQTAPEKNPVRNFVDTASDVAEQAIGDSQARYKERKAAQAARHQQNAERTQAIDDSAAKMADAIFGQSSRDVDTAEKQTAAANAADAAASAASDDAPKGAGTTDATSSAAPAADKTSTETKSA